MARNNYAVDTIVRKLQKNDPNVQKLRLSGIGDITGRAPLGPEAAKVLAAALRHDERCIDLDFSGNKASDAGTHHIAQALSTNAALTALDLSWSEIGFKGAESLARFLGGYVSQAGGRGSIESISSTSGWGWGNSTLTYLNLGCNKLGDRGAVALAPALAQLDMKQQKLVVAADNSMTTYYYRPSMLAYLDLRSNQIGPLGARALSSALARNHTLTCLDMQGNRLGTEGSSRLANCLAPLQTVNSGSGTTQNITAGGIDSDGSAAACVCDADCAVHHGGNRTLAHVNLSSNKISDEGISAWRLGLLAQVNRFPALSSAGAEFVGGGEHKQRNTKNWLLGGIHGTCTGLMYVELGGNKVTDAALHSLRTVLLRTHNMMGLSVNRFKHVSDVWGGILLPPPAPPTLAPKEDSDDEESAPAETTSSPRPFGMQRSCSGVGLQTLPLRAAAREHVREARRARAAAAQAAAAKGKSGLEKEEQRRAAEEDERARSRRIRVRVRRLDRLGGEGILSQEEAEATVEADDAKAAVRAGRAVVRRAKVAEMRAMRRKWRQVGPTAKWWESSNKMRNFKLWKQAQVLCHYTPTDPAPRFKKSHSISDLQSGPFVKGKTSNWKLGGKYNLGVEDSSSEEEDET